MGERLISVLDLGSSAVKFLIAEVSDGNYSIIGVGNVPSKSINKGVVTDLNKACEAILQARKQAENMSNKKAGAVFVSVSGAHVYSLNNKGSVIISKEGREISKDDIRRVEESAKVLLLQPNQSIVHVLPRQFIIDGQGGIKNPVGMSGIKLEEEVHIVTGSSTVLYNIKKAISMADLEFGDFVLQSLASSYATLTDQEKEIGVALLDIGAGTGDLIVFNNGSVAHTSVLPIGGEYITKDLAQILRISFDESETLKRKHGFVYREDEEIGDELVEIERIGSREKVTEKLSRIGDIITDRVDEILEGVKLELMKSGYWSSIHSGIVITGGCSLLKGFVDRASYVLDAPARLGYPSSDFVLADTLSSPEYATSVGLVLYASEHTEVRRKRANFDFSWLKELFE